ncbi:MAG: glycoside hydrolase domain-containing protein [Nocardioides sp.]
MSRTVPTRTPAGPVRRALLAATSALLAVTVLGAPAGPTAYAASGERRSSTVSEDGVVVTPGSFTGYGFDQCLAPTSEAMRTWWNHSPFQAVGIYISGKSRACRNQPNLTPEWVRQQSRLGWRLLPITLGPQASCQPRFPRYDDDVRINPRPGRSGTYNKALKMGRAEAATTVADAKALGIGEGSTLWYDLEGFDATNTACRESALSFLSGWTQALHRLGYVSGVYSSASSGIKALDDARVNRPDRFTLPDAIWIARWDGNANTDTTYIRADGWRPGGRMKQYLGGHDETWGGVRINIDSNFLDLGTGTTAKREKERCGGVRVNFQDYDILRPPRTTANGEQIVPDAALVTALQCLLREKKYFEGELTGEYGAKTLTATHTWQAEHGFDEQDLWSRTHWMSLLAAGSKDTIKYGSSGLAVRRLQRTLNAASPHAQLVVTGVYGPGVEPAVKAWQKRVGLPQSGVVNGEVWRILTSGTRT